MNIVKGVLLQYAKANIMNKSYRATASACSLCIAFYLKG